MGGIGRFCLILYKKCGGALSALQGEVGSHDEIVRDRWVQSVLTRVPDGARILDAGAGLQPYRELCTHLRYVAQDFGRYDGRGDGTGEQTGTWNHRGLDIVSDVAVIPEPDASFDAILCTEVLEHVPDPVRAVAEFARLLKSGGHLILTAPFNSATHFAPFHFCTGFNRYWYSHHLTALGFEIVEIEPNGNFFECVANEVRMLPGAALRYCAKPASMIIAVLAFFFSLPLLAVIGFASQRDRASSDLGCRGYNVLARRRSDPAA